MSDGPKLTALGKLFIFLFIAICVVGAYYFFTGKTPWSYPGKSSGSGGGILDSLGGGEQGEIGIAYGTGKQRWLGWAVQEFAKSRGGKLIEGNLIRMGSLEGADALLKRDQRIPAWSYQKKTKDLGLKDVVDVGFQNWLQNFERGVSGLSNSTGNMMREMVLKGPSSYDALFVYESVTIDYLKNAEGRWGQIRVVYPEYNAWNENPYYIIDAPWSSKDQRKAAEAFLAFLLSEPIQK